MAFPVVLSWLRVISISLLNLCQCTRSPQMSYIKTDHPKSIILLFVFLISCERRQSMQGIVNILQNKDAEVGRGSSSFCGRI